MSTYHVVLGCVGKERLFKIPEDYRKWMELLKFYKDKYEIKLIGYALTEQRIHLLLVDRKNQRASFLDTLIATYGYYFEERYHIGELFHRKIKEYRVTTQEALLEIYKQLHKRGVNSRKKFEEYHMLKKDPLLSGDVVINSFGNDRRTNKDVFLGLLVKEPKATYQRYIKNAEFFPEDKKTIRIKRAKSFMETFLREVGVNRKSIGQDHYRNVRLQLVKEFRQKTDLSFRDIGAVMGLSHTSIIRMWKQVIEQELDSLVDY